MDTLVRATQVHDGLSGPAVGSARSRRIVVAVDGSDGSIEALVWTRDVLVGAGDSVLAITGYTPPPCAPEAPVGAEAVFHRAECARIAGEIAIGRVFGAHEPGQAVEHLVGFGSMECLALRESAEADLIVVGPQPHQGLLGWFRWSGIKRLTRYASCPVVSVPAGFATAEA